MSSVCLAGMLTIVRMVREHLIQRYINQVTMNKSERKLQGSSRA